MQILFYWVPWSWADGVDVGHAVLDIVVEYSAAFWMLTRGRCRWAPVEFVEFIDVVDMHEFDVFTVEVDVNEDGVESNNSCCTCKISTYSSRPDGLAALFNLESLIDFQIVS